MTPAAQKTSQVLLVDDHPIVRQGLSRLIEQHPDLRICGSAEDATSALALLDQTSPDIAIVDLSLKETSGLTLIREMRKRRRDLPILVLSMHDELNYAERSLCAGANGYIMKQEATEKLLGAIRRVLGGDVYLSEAISGRLLNRLVGGGVSAAASPLSRLSEREHEVLAMIGQGMGPRQIADKLNLSVKTVDTHRDHIKEKLGIRSAAELARFAIQNDESAL